MSTTTKVLTNYDVTLIFPAESGKSEIKDIVARYIGYLKHWNNTCLEVLYLGKKTLAYPIQKNSRGTFVNLKILAAPGVINRLQETLRQDESILRNQIIQF